MTSRAAIGASRRRLSGVHRTSAPPPTALHGIERMIYVDDSYDDKHSGVIVFGWVEVAPHLWRTALRTWLEHRKRLVADFAVPVSQELHSTAFMNGRGNINADPSVLSPAYLDSKGEVLKKDLGRDVALRCLETVRDCTDVRVGAAWTQTDRRGPDFAAEKYALYGRLLNRLDREHAARGTFALMSMDGDDVHFRQAHRELKLDSRHIIEDPHVHDSKRSQWIQIADMVAYTALMSLNRHARNEFGQGWYGDYLAAKDVNGDLSACRHS